MLSGILTEIYKDTRESIKKKREVSAAEKAKEKAEIENASHRYEKNYRVRHGQIKVFCVGMREPIPLDDVYVAVQFLDKQNAARYGSLKDVEEAFQERYQSRRFTSNRQARKDGTMVANEKQYLMLLGGPGFGKSTFLRKVGLEALKEENGDFEHACIPVFLELKRFTADQINIEALITEEFRTCGYPDPDRMTESALKLGKLLILLDGLDEVPAANVDNVVGKIGDFVDRYSQNRFIASCRVAAYKGGFTRFTEVEMAEFDDAQIEAYIKNWFDSTPHQYRQQLDAEMGTAQQCWGRLSETSHKATKELARNPLLLTLLCMVYDNSQDFPRNRAALYEDALNIFLREWAAEKRIRREESIGRYLDIADEKRMLSEIAWNNFKNNRLFLSEDELIDQIQKFGDGNANTLPEFNAPKILETILVDQGLFIEQVSGSYSFSHLTFQEYLTANYVVRDTSSIQELVSKHLHDEHWREVFLFTAGRMHAADDLLIMMEAEAAKCINTNGLKMLFQWAERITDTLNDKDKGDSKRVFVICQYFSLRLFDTIHEGIKKDTREDIDLLHYLQLYRRLYVYRGPYANLDRDLLDDLNSYRVLYADLYQDIDRALYRARAQEFYLYIDRDLFWYLYLYRDFYRHMDTDFLLLVSSRFGARFGTELDDRIELIEYMEAAQIFKGVDLQRIVLRFKTQQEFIKAAREGKTVERPEKSIHDTWLSVLQITDEMLSISQEELENYVQYLRAVRLMVDCKEAAGRVSPEVWNGIEERFLTLDAIEYEA